MDTPASASIDKKAITIGYAYAMADIIAGMGCDKGLLLRNSGIPENIPAETPMFISILQYEALIKNALKISGDPAIGLKIGEGIKFGHHGTFAFAALSFPTVWDAMKVGLKFSRLMNNIIELQLEEGETFHIIRFESACFSGVVYRAVIEIVMAMFCQQFKFMLEGDLGGMKISFRYEKPDYGELYTHVLEPMTRFEADANEIHIPITLANKPLAMANPITARLFVEECNKALARMNEQRGVPDQVREQLVMANNGFPSLDEVAARIHISPRTLRRHLKIAGTSFQKILDQVRMELAQRYLTSTQRSIGEIAYLLGYEDPNSFSHAFKVLTGMPPTSYRKHKQ